MVVKIKCVEILCAVFLCSLLKFLKLICLVLAKSLLQFIKSYYGKVQTYVKVDNVMNSSEPTLYLYRQTPTKYFEANPRYVVSSY